ncbi:MAG: hypothetical protein JWP89_20 [Schlesneria sp.]|nr:hypothetical protein [Schlesneria sp.]
MIRLVSGAQPGDGVKLRLIVRSRRGGQSLVLFVMVLFGLLALAALVIDLGVARVSQRQMQSIADAAALAAANTYNSQFIITNDDVASDQSARTEAREWVSNHFNSLDSSYGSVRIIDTIAGADDAIAARQNLERDPDGGLLKDQYGRIDPSDPNQGLQLNSANNIHGDVVRGYFHESATHEEGETYLRDDFVGDPSGSAWLIRLRRTSDRDSLASEAGTSSRGVAIPFLFGRGTTMQSTSDPAEQSNPENVYAPRKHGITVRATAIASPTSVKSVGPPNETYLKPGVTPFAVVYPPTGSITFTSPCYLLNTPQAVVSLGGLGPSQLTLGSVPVKTDQQCYLPLIDPSSLYVVCFLYVQTWTSINPTTVEVTVTPGYVAGTNASAAISMSSIPDGLATQAQSIMDVHHSFQTDSLKIPVLSR